MTQHSGWLKWPKGVVEYSVKRYLMDSQKVEKLFISSFPGKRESRNFVDLVTFWIPVFTGMTTFCEIVILDRLGVPARTTDRHLAKLISGAKIERRGSKKTGGYYYLISCW